MTINLVKSAMLLFSALGPSTLLSAEASTLSASFLLAVTTVVWFYIHQKKSKPYKILGRKDKKVCGDMGSYESPLLLNDDIQVGAFDEKCMYKCF
jgi:hypothetical protein